MLTKTTKMALGAHTAGIFADMSIDGPEIGTLVAVFDRAKNLPNRKTMGKQNPYCAARLGKEAKKTDTDMRGGQTPRWDQELRFTVHESPDYLQLKVSVFNDDKRTDLIGETWIDLKNVVVPGGGQNDLWHNLQCKGKYAGEIRMEMTYYDSRPKDVAVIERRKEAAAEKSAARKEGGDPHSNARKSKVPKRRPLPADPTGAQPPAEPEKQRKRVPKHSHTQSQTQQAPVPAEPPVNPPPPAVHAPQQPRVYETPDDLHQQWETPSAQPAVNELPSETHPQHNYQPRQLDSRDTDQENAARQPAVNNYPPPQPPQPQHERQVYQQPTVNEQPATQLPLAQSHHKHHPYQPDPRGVYQDNGGRQPAVDNYPADHFKQEPGPYQPDPRDVYQDHINREPPATQHPPMQPMHSNQLHEADPRDLYLNNERTAHSSRKPPSIPMPNPQDHFNPPHSSGHYMPDSTGSEALQVHALENAYNEPALDHSHGHYDMQVMHNTQQVAVLESRRKELPSYRPVSRDSPYEPNDPYAHHQVPHAAPPSTSGQPNRGAHRNSYARNDVYQDLPMRKPVNRIEYRPSQDYMQPYVEDFGDEHEEDVPPPPPIHRDGLRKPLPPQQPAQPRPQPSFDYTSHQETKAMPVPEPLHISRRESPQYLQEEVQQEYIAYSPRHSIVEHPKSNLQPDAQYSTSPAPSYRSYMQESPPSYSRPTTSNGEIVPSSLMAGYDSSTAEGPSTHAMPDEYELGHRKSHSSMRSTMVQDHPMRSSPSPIPGRTSTRTSPDPRKVPSRKSLSPLPRAQPDLNSIQGTPFGPDSFDVLNPNATNSAAMQAPDSPYDTPAEAMEAARQHEVNKLRELGPIIGNDGREIDPSDHLPSDTWAPEPDRKQKKPGVVVRFKHTSQTNQVGLRPSARDRESQQQRGNERGHDQGMVLARPRSSGRPSYHSYHSSLSNTSQATGDGGPSPPPTRNRLVKQSGRPQSSYTPSSSMGPDRLSPSPGLPNTRDHDSQPIYTPPHYRPSSRHSTAPQAQGQRQLSPSPSPRASNFYEVSGPPIPAKVPIHPASQDFPINGSMNGHAHSSSLTSNGHGGELDALSEEMRRIDIGTSKYAGSTAGGRRPRPSYVGAYGH